LKARFVLFVLAQRHSGSIWQEAINQNQYSSDF